MTRWQRLRLLLLRWHRRVGAVVALFLLWLAFSGIALNHTEQLKLAEKPLASDWLLSHYGVKLPAIRSFALDSRWLSQGGARLFLEADEIAYCQGQLLGVVATGRDILLLCEREMLALSHDGQLLERIQALDGLPQGLQRIGRFNKQTYLQSLDTEYLFDWRNLTFQQQALDAGLVQWSTPGELPEIMLSRLLHAFAGSEINIERLMLDLHSGRFFGDIGVYIVDVAALLFCFLALSGLWVWGGAKYRRRRR